MSLVPKVVASLEAALAGFEPRTLPAAEALAAVEALARAERLCAAAKARAVAWVDEAGLAKAAGERSTAEWLARAQGTSVGAAKAVIETAAAAAWLPVVEGALAAGDLSAAQARLVVTAAEADPSAQESLVEVARSGSLERLRDEARKVRDRAITDVEERHRRQVAAREFRHWVDEDGMVSGRFRLAPEVGTPIVNRIEGETDRQYGAAYKEGRREERVAYAADAFVSCLTGQAKGGKGRADLVVVVDLDAYRRGHTHDGERCHIPGVGRLPVCVAREIGTNAFLKGVVIDGTDITTVKHFGRHVPAELRTALELGKPPELDGRVCDVCGTRMGCQFDHDDPRANGGAISLENIHDLCRPDHRTKTERDRAAGLLAGSGKDPP